MTTAAAIAQAQDHRAERVLLMIDVSGSMDETDYPPCRLAAAQDASLGFLAEKARLGMGDHMGLVSFGSNGRMVHSLVPVRTGQAQLRSAIQRLTTNGSTNMAAGLKCCQSAFDSKSSAMPNMSVRGLMDWLFRSPVQAQPGVDEQVVVPNARRIVVLTDGHHNEGPNPLPIATQLKSDGVAIECIGIGGEPSDVEESLLKQMASTDPDGRQLYWFISDRAGLIRKFRECATGLRAVEG